MHKALLAVLLIGLASLAPYLYDNTDYDAWSEDDTLIVTSAKKTYEDMEVKRLDQLKDVFDATANVCLNGKSASSLTAEQQVNEFIKGPCAPIVLVPGITGTSLQVKIDCELLWAENPEIFENCGWNTCGSSIFKKKPHSEYRLWISGTTSPMAVIMTNKKAKCFGDIIHQIYDPSKPDPKDRYPSPYGLQIEWYGNTEETKSGSECGLGAVYEISDDYIVKAAMCDSKGFHSLRDLFINMGYLNGVTLQAIPYDWRKSIAASVSQVQLAQTIKNIYTITGKKTYIIGHSLGTLHSTNVMYNMDQATKDKMVAGIIPMGGPLLGATKTWKATLGGDDGFLVHLAAVGDVGVNYYSQDKMINSASSVADLYPKDTYIKYRNEPWMVQILERMQLEAEYKKTKQFPASNYPLDWFPSPREVCGAGFEARADECLLLMQDLSEPFLFVEDRQYISTSSSIEQALYDNKQKSDAQTLMKFYEESKRSKADALEHPGVPMIIIYGAHSETPYKFTYFQNPREVVAASGDFYFPDYVQKSVGDSTVLVSSSITPAIKWIYEHQQGKTKYPTKLIEYCSEARQGSIYDETDAQGTRKFNKSGYLGLSCQCKNGAVAMGSCSHPCMINDPQLVTFVADIVQNNEKSSIQATPYTNQQILDHVSNCVNLK